MYMFSFTSGSTSGGLCVSSVVRRLPTSSLRVTPVSLQRETRAAVQPAGGGSLVFAAPSPQRERCVIFKMLTRCFS